jgi:hypothetical protein
VREWGVRLSRFAERHLQRARIRFVCLSVLTMSLLLLAIFFVTANKGQTVFGPALGADYAGFYVAGTILNRDQGDRLYDFALQNRCYHELFPNRGQWEQLPYVHPPLVALVFRPLAALPYAESFALWLVLSAGLYLTGLALLLKTCSRLPRCDRGLVVLLALSFEPFLIECWLGGQLSAVAFFFVALALYWQWKERPIQSGLALGLCLYKPTLLLLVLPMLMAARRWRTLAGFALGGLTVAGASCLAVGWRGCLDFLHVLIGFARTTTAQEQLVLPTWKYVDLNAFLRLLFGEHTFFSSMLLLLSMAVVLPPLWAAYRRWDRLSLPSRRLLWASTLTWTLVTHFYVGVYDTVLVVPGLVLTADVCCRRSAKDARTLPPGFTILLVFLYAVPWLSQHLARVMVFQPYTLVLAAVGIYQLLLVRRLDAAVVGEREQSCPNSPAAANVNSGAPSIGTWPTLIETSPEM